MASTAVILMLLQWKEKALKICECKFGLTYLEHFFPSNAARMLQYSQQDGWWVIKKLLANIKHSKNISNNQKIKKLPSLNSHSCKKLLF